MAGKVENSNLAPFNSSTNPSITTSPISIHTAALLLGVASRSSRSPSWSSATFLIRRASCLPAEKAAHSVRPVKMASPKAASEQLPAESVQAQSPNGEVVNGGVQENAEDAPVAGVEQGMKGLGVSEEAGSALHRACAEGRLDGVREALSRGVESLEVLGELPLPWPLVAAVFIVLIFGIFLIVKSRRSGQGP